MGFSTTEEPTAEEYVLIEQFRERVFDVLETKEHDSNAYLIRWIRARDNDLEKAEEMLRNNLRWRKENGLDNVLNKPMDEFYLKNFPYSLAGHDKHGHPVLECPMGSWDIRKAVDSSHGGEDGFILYTNQLFEKAQQAIRNSNKDKVDGEYPNTLFSCVVDWKGYSFSQLWNYKSLQNMLSLASRYEAYYPEILHKMHFINCPKVFSLLFALVKPLLAPKTLSKIVIHETYDDWLEALDEDFDRDQLGTTFGGTAIRSEAL